MGLASQEQETTINFFRDSDICTIFTSDSTVMTKLDKLAANPDAPHWNLKEEHKLQNGDVVGKTYETKKRLISFRADITTREFTSEQREAAAARLREWQDRKKAMLER